MVVITPVCLTPVCKTSKRGLVAVPRGAAAHVFRTTARRGVYAQAPHPYGQKTRKGAQAGTFFFFPWRNGEFPVRWSDKSRRGSYVRVTRPLRHIVPQRTMGADHPEEDAVPAQAMCFHALALSVDCPGFLFATNTIPTNMPRKRKESHGCSRSSCSCLTSTSGSD